MPLGREHSDKRRTLLLSLLLVLVVFGVFLPATRNDFTSYDDPLYVSANSHVQHGLTWAGIKWAFRCTGGTANWHPLTWLSHMLDCQVFGLRPWGHHLTSIVLHSANALLLFFLLRAMTGAIWRSAVVAALFGLHPIHVESVAWVAERKDVLSACFWLLTFWFYCIYAKKPALRPRRAFYALSLVCFVLGLMSKPMLVTVPFVLLLLDYWPLRRLEPSTVRRLIIEKIPFFGISTVISINTFLIQKESGEMSMVGTLPFVWRLENAIISYARYLGKIFWPVDLAVFYPHPGHWPPGSVLAATVVVAAVSVLMLVMGRRHRYLPVGWFWFLGTLVPVIGLVQVGAQSMADRYIYMPSVGIFLVLVWGACDLAERWPKAAGIETVSAAVVLALCSVLTIHQISYWQNSTTLFKRAASVTKDNWRALNNLGAALLHDGRLDEAEKVLQEAALLNPGDASVHNNLAGVLMRQRRFEEAIEELRKVLSFRPTEVTARVNLGAVLVNRGRFAEAIPYLEAAVKLAPKNSAGHDMLGIALLGTGRFAEAIEQYRTGVSLNPESPVIRNNLGIALMRAGSLDEALAQFQESLHLKPDSAQTYRNMGEVQAKEAHWDAAATNYQKSLQLEPTSAEGHFQLALVLIRLNKRTDAIDQLRQALRLQPNFSQAAQALRIISAEPGA